MKLRILALLSLIAVAGTGVASQRSIDPREIFKLAGLYPKTAQTMSALYALRPELASATYAVHRKTFAEPDSNPALIKAKLAVMLRQEHELTENGYTVLYHGMSGETWALQLFYKMLYVAVMDVPVRQDFEFLRFWADPDLTRELPRAFVEQKPKAFERKKWTRVLSANLSLFGNSLNDCCHTLGYFLKGVPEQEYVEVSQEAEQDEADSITSDDEFGPKTVCELAEEALRGIGMSDDVLYGVLADFYKLIDFLTPFNVLLQIAIPNQLVNRLCYVTGGCDTPQSLGLRPHDGVVDSFTRGIIEHKVISSAKLKGIYGDKARLIPSWKLRETVEFVRKWHKLFNRRDLDRLQARIILNPDIVCDPNGPIRFTTVDAIPPRMHPEFMRVLLQIMHKLDEAVADIPPVEV